MKENQHGENVNGVNLNELVTQLTEENRRLTAESNVLQKKLIGKEEIVDGDDRR